MNTYIKRTLCSIIFASLVTTQLSGMLSFKKKKELITGIKGSSLSHHAAHEPILSIEDLSERNNTPIISLKSFSKKKTYKKIDEEESQETKDRKTKRKNKLIILGSTATVVGFLVDNKKKFIPEFNAAENPLGSGDLKPLNEGLRIPIPGTSIGTGGSGGGIFGIVFMIAGWATAKILNDKKKDKNPYEDIINNLPLTDYEMAAIGSGAMTCPSHKQEEYQKRMIENIANSKALSAVINPNPNPKSPKSPYSNVIVPVTNDKKPIDTEQAKKDVEKVKKTVKKESVDWVPSMIL